MEQLNFVYNILSTFFKTYIFVFYNPNNQLDFIWNSNLETLKENLLKTLKVLNIDFKELTDDLIEISLFNNTQILIPNSVNGFFILNYLHVLYHFDGIYIDILDYYTQMPGFSFPILFIPKLNKKLPLNYDEFHIFFNSLRGITDFKYIGNISLNDIFYDEINKYYIILNFECLEYKSPYIEVRLDNLLNESGNIYYLNNQPLNTNDFYFFKNMGMI